MKRQEIIKQYVESLKEDNELDYIFPILLERMGYRVLSTPRQSKGQSQYGRDVIAIKKIKGVSTLFLFELKGFGSKDITDRTLNEKDGLIESLRASRYTPYEDVSVPNLCNFPRYYVFVHNGLIDANALPTFNGFIKTEFPNGNFEEWDISVLTTYFSEYLFDETLLADDESYRLFKKILVLLDGEGNTFKDISSLIDIQLSKIGTTKKENKRILLNMFATLRLIAHMIHFYSIECGNLLPAKYCIDTIILKTWAWILRTKKEKKTFIINHLNCLIGLQIQIYGEYINKILSVVQYPKGLFCFEPTDSEYMFYPLRCYDFLGDLVYFYLLTESFYNISKQEQRNRMEILKNIIENNNACTMPLLDTHSITIQIVFLYMYKYVENQEDRNSLGKYLIYTVINLIKRYEKQEMWPEMYGNLMALAKSLYVRDDDYHCESSLLLMVIFELLSYLNLPNFYSVLKQKVEESGVNLQVAYPIIDEFDIEQLLFEKRLNNELAVQTNIKLPETIKDFQNNYVKKYNSIEYRSDKAGYYFLRVLAHKYYETDLFPDFLGRTYCK